MSLMILSERHRFYHRNEIEMDFSAWSPSHTILFLFEVAVFIYGPSRVDFRRMFASSKQKDAD